MLNLLQHPSFDEDREFAQHSDVMRKVLRINEDRPAELVQGGGPPDEARLPDPEKPHHSLFNFR